MDQKSDTIYFVYLSWAERSPLLFKHLGVGAAAAVATAANGAKLKANVPWVLVFCVFNAFSLV